MNDLRVRLLRPLGYMEQLSIYVLALAGAVLVAAILTQVVMRYLFAMPLFGVEELARSLALWIYFIGASFALARDEHISASILDLLSIPPLLRLSIDSLVWILVLIACLLTAWYAVHYTLWVYRSGELTPGLWWPRYWLVGATAFGSLAMTLIALSKTLRLLSRVRIHAQETTR